MTNLNLKGRRAPGSGWQRFNVRAKMKVLPANLALALLIVACKGKSSTEPYEVAFYRAAGSYTSPSDNWKIEIDRNDLGLSVTRDVSDRSIAGKFEGTLSVSPGEWTNKTGFFCAVDRNDRIWAFDGGSRIWILKRHGDGVMSMEIAMAGGLPPEIESALPPALAIELTERDSADKR